MNGWVMEHASQLRRDLTVGTVNAVVSARDEPQN